MPRLKGQSNHNRFRPEKARVDAVSELRWLYWSEVICIHGHVRDGKTLRRTVDYKCQACRLEGQRRVWHKYKAASQARQQSPKYKAAAAARSKLWRKNNPEHHRALQNNYEARVRTCTPPWASSREITQFYKRCPEGHEVDHIVPLRGRSVSGLHVMANLQYLKSRDNRTKSNRFIAE